MKPELLVIANQQVAVNTFPGLYTPPVKPWKPEVPEIALLTARMQAPKVKSVTGAKS